MFAPFALRRSTTVRLCSYVPISVWLQTQRPLCMHALYPSNDAFIGIRNSIKGSSKVAVHARESMRGDVKHAIPLTCNPGHVCYSYADVPAKKQVYEAHGLSLKMFLPRDLSFVHCRLVRSVLSLFLRPGINASPLLAGISGHHHLLPCAAM